MRTLIWILLGWLGVTFWTALGARLELGYILPDAAVVTVVFLALRREPIPVAASALVLGYFVGRQACAPLGLHETALVGSAIGVYIASGHLVGSGALFFASVSAMTVVGYHVLMYLLLTTSDLGAGFASWTTALLVPNAMATGVLALISYPWMIRLERRLAPERHEGLAWR